MHVCVRVCVLYVRAGGRKRLVFTQVKVQGVSGICGVCEQCVHMCVCLPTYVHAHTYTCERSVGLGGFLWCGLVSSEVLCVRACVIVHGFM